MQACLVLKQFEYILNVTEYVNENYLIVKEKYLKIMSNHKVTSAVLPPVGLRRLLLRIEDLMHANP